MTGTETTPVRWTKKPVTVDARQWTGDNFDEIVVFTGRDLFIVLGEEDRANSDDPDCSASVFDKLHSTWVGVMDGQWIIRGVKGEFYPCDAEVFAETYEPAEAASSGDDPAERLLALELPPNDSGATTVRGYLIALLAAVWRETEGFSGKRPFGNSSWQCDLYAPMIKAGFVPGTLDEDGYLDGYFDEAPADALILAAIERLGQPS